MQAARTPRSGKTVIKLMVVKDGGNQIADSSVGHFPEYLQSGDLLVINDAATLPASLLARDAKNNQLEIRLTSQLDQGIWQVVTLGEGDWRIPTENRPLPPELHEGEEIFIAPDFCAKIVNANRLSDRLLDLEFNLSGEELWRGLYSYGKPVQYSYMKDELQLWSVQNVYSSRPWAVEMPSAGHALNWQILLQLIRKGVKVVPLTHSAGLSSTGDAKIDQALPLAERFDIPATTMEAVRQTKADGRRVIAIGTSVVRALESAQHNLNGFTDLKLGPGYQPKLVDGLLTGTHDVSESHYQLLRAFLPESALAKVSQHLEDQNYLTHEFGDLCLIL